MRQFSERVWDHFYIDEYRPRWYYMPAWLIACGLLWIVPEIRARWKSYVADCKAADRPGHRVSPISYFDWIAYHLIEKRARQVRKDE